MLPLQVEEAGKRSEDLMKQHLDNTKPAEEAPADQDPQPKTEDLQKSLADLQAKYDVLAGKYKKEIENADLKDLQRLRGENANLRREMTQLREAMVANQNLVKEVQEELEKNKAKPAAAAPSDVDSLLTEEEREHLEAEDFGRKTREIIYKLIQAGSGGDIQGELRKISTQVEGISTRVTKNEETSKQATIRSEIPDFYEINDLPEFHKWLDDSFRRAELQSAISSGNFAKVKKGIDLFKAETGYGKPAEPPKTPKKEPPIEPNESFTHDGSQLPKDKPTYTRAQIKEHHEGFTKGHWKDRETQWQAISDDMLRAGPEGRILP